MNEQNKHIFTYHHPCTSIQSLWFSCAWVFTPVLIIITVFTRGPGSVLQRANETSSEVCSACTAYSSLNPYSMWLWLRNNPEAKISYSLYLAAPLFWQRSILSCNHPSGADWQDRDTVVNHCVIGNLSFYFLEAQFTYYHSPTELGSVMYTCITPWEAGSQVHVNGSCWVCGDISSISTSRDFRMTVHAITVILLKEQTQRYIRLNKMLCEPCATNSYSFYHRTVGWQWNAVRD